VRASLVDGIRRWQEWEADQPWPLANRQRIAILAGLLLVVPLIAFALYVPTHVDALVFWLMLMMLWWRRHDFERRAIQHPREFALMVGLYVSLSSVARLIDYVRFEFGGGRTPQLWMIAYLAVAALVLLAIGMVGGKLMSRDASRRFGWWAERYGGR
jgi:hypothetical protein